mmetsp:Transcript_13318/g.41152  ORF Transcript_13318/g.41152 Transcript_13318/m.41152 type:complete len:282 (+) Transcript_13318:549-1394(+)
MRDFFVFQLSDEILVRFAYDPAYLPKADTYWTDDSAARVARRVWGSSLSFVDVVLDGGSIAWEPSTRRAVVTERVLRDNPSLVGKESLGEADRGALDPYADAPAISHEDAAAGAEALADVLNAALGRDDVAVVIVPEEPGAPTLGHVDGIANWLAPSVLALSDFSDAETYEMFEGRIVDAFPDVDVVPYPYEPVDAAWRDGMASAEGVYVNFARTKNVIYVPVFGRSSDARDRRGTRRRAGRGRQRIRGGHHGRLRTLPFEQRVGDLRRSRGRRRETPRRR